MSQPQALIATQRFGLGARPGELAQRAADPKGWLLDQIGTISPVPNIQPAAERVAFLAEARKVRQEMKQAADKNADAFAQLKTEQRELYLGDTTARLQAAVASDTPFVERWVRFWSNHFTVSIARPVISALVMPFENEAIRPHVFGHLVDLALAVVRHPAMLIYLDNAQSIGPNSRLGQRKEAGLNENLARELMELHTLGVDGGYSQNDVRSLAKILTGWTIARPGRMAQNLGTKPGNYRFAAFAHEPGDKVLLGQIYAENGEQEGVAAIHALCAHPATANHIARKIARHFLSDDPPPEAVASLQDEFSKSGGDLSAVARRLISLPQSWSLPMTKARPPEEWLIAIRRAFPSKEETQPRKVIGALQQLGQVPFAAPSPAGWPDESAAWLGPEALMARLDFAKAAAERIEVAEPQTMTDRILGPAVRDESRLQIARAPSVPDAVALLLVSPEFMLR